MDRYKISKEDKVKVLNEYANEFAANLREKRHKDELARRIEMGNKMRRRRKHIKNITPFSSENQPTNRMDSFKAEDEDHLSISQRQLVEAYFATGSKIKAFQATDYAITHTADSLIDVARAARNKFSSPKIKNAIMKRQRELVSRYRITAERVLKEYACLAFSDITDYYVVEGNDIRWKTRDELTPEQRAAIKDISIFENVVSNTRKIAKMNLHSKKDALEALSKYLGLFEKHNMQLTKVNIAVDEIISGLPEGISDAVRQRLADRINNEVGDDILDFSTEERTIN